VLRTYVIRKVEESDRAKWSGLAPAEKAAANSTRPNDDEIFRTRRKMKDEWCRRRLLAEASGNC
jgi:hypothetical protein